MQTAGRKPRESALHGRLVARLRGVIETKANRTLNQSRCIGSLSSPWNGSNSAPRGSAGA
jgi:hypothetical protein